MEGVRQRLSWKQEEKREVEGFVHVLRGQNQEIIGELDHFVVVNEHLRNKLDRKA